MVPTKFIIIRLKDFQIYKNGFTVLTVIERINSSWWTKLEFLLMFSSGFKPRGNLTITCLPSGHWTRPEGACHSKYSIILFINRISNYYFVNFLNTLKTQNQSLTNQTKNYQIWNNSVIYIGEKEYLLFKTSCKFKAKLL